MNYWNKVVACQLPFASEANGKCYHIDNNVKQKSFHEYKGVAIGTD